MHENCVLFKGKRDGIVILLSEDVDFATIIEHLKKKVVDAQKFFHGAKMSIMFKGRILSELELQELLLIISEETKLDISFIHEDENSSESPRSSTEERKPSEYTRFQNTMTKFYKGTVRSGQCIEFSGSIIVIGDINPGGEIVAEGNIIILGSLKGMVHAGCKGNSEAVVMALEMLPMQIRIGDIITRLPDQSRAIKSIDPQIAYVCDSRVYVEPLDHKALENL